MTSNVFGGTLSLTPLQPPLSISGILLSSTVKLTVVPDLSENRVAFIKGR